MSINKHYCTEHIRECLDSGYYVCGVFVDLEKAFDTVNHKILCEKLNHYGLRGNINKLIQSYLANRKQYVSLNNGYASISWRAPPPIDATNTQRNTCQTPLNLLCL